MEILSDPAEISTLAHFDTARMALERARTIDEVKDIRDKAEALHRYIKQACESLEMQNACAEIKLRAERRAGELLREMEKHPGTVLAGRDPGGDFRKSHDETADKTPTLSDIGISKSQSSRWQAIADIPEETFEEHLAETKAAGRELTSAGALRLAKRLNRGANRVEWSVEVSEVTGDMFQLYTGDFIEMCREHIADDSVDFVITDPPYGGDSLPASLQPTRGSCTSCPETGRLTFVHDWSNPPCSLADNSHIPFLVVFYDNRRWLFWVVPINEIAQLHFPQRLMMCERNYVSWLYRLRGIPVPKDIYFALSIWLPTKASYEASY